eukprot:scaffold44084_cov35-Phaeocystis_antarctica.AAC.2
MDTRRLCQQWRWSPARSRLVHRVGGPERTIAERSAPTRIVRAWARAHARPTAVQVTHVCADGHAAALSAMGIEFPRWPLSQSEGHTWEFNPESGTLGVARPSGALSGALIRASSGTV